MRRFKFAAMLLCLSWISACTPLIVTHDPQKERLDFFTREVMAAQNLARVRDKIVVLSPAKSEGGFRLSNLAWTNTYDKSGNTTTYAVHIDPIFLRDGIDILFEHVAQHEVCHLKNDDLRRSVDPGENIELAVEYCVRRLVGGERYRQYVRNYQRWRPNTFELEEARQIVISNLAP